MRYWQGYYGEPLIEEVRAQAEGEGVVAGVAWLAAPYTEKVCKLYFILSSLLQNVCLRLITKWSVTQAVPKKLKQ